MVSDRIKLAEAMGWLRIKRMADGCWFSPNGEPDGDWINFDPFTDANDDYAVLEWMRNARDKYCGRIYEELYSLDAVDYQVGDYARAALKVIGDSDNCPDCDGTLQPHEQGCPNRTALKER